MDSVYHYYSSLIDSANCIVFFSSNATYSSTLSAYGSLKLSNNTSVYNGPYTYGRKFHWPQSPWLLAHEISHRIGKSLDPTASSLTIVDRGIDQSASLYNPLYGTTYVNVTTGTYDLMYHNDNHSTENSLYGQIPLSSYDLIKLGWIASDEILEIHPLSTSSLISIKLADLRKQLTAQQKSNNYFRVVKIFLNENFYSSCDEYLLVEYHKGTDYDRHFYNYDEGLCTGILIWHVAETSNSSNPAMEILTSVPYNGYYGNPLPDDSYPKTWEIYSYPSNWTGILKSNEYDWLNDLKLSLPAFGSFSYAPNGGRHIYEVLKTDNANWYRCNSKKDDFFSDSLVKGRINNRLLPTTIPSTRDWWGNQTNIGIINIITKTDRMEFDFYNNYWTGSIVESQTVNGTIHVYGDLIINNDVSFTLEAGSVVKFHGNAKLTVNGTLNVQGTSSEPVTFTRSGSSGLWGGIYVSSGGNADFNWCNIKNASVGIDADNSGTVQINHTNLDNCFIAISVDGLSSVDFYGSKIENYESRGITLDDGATVWSEYSFITWQEGSELDPDQIGIQNYGGDVSVLYSQISNNGQGLFNSEGSWADLGYDECSDESGFNNIVCNLIDINTLEDIVACYNYWGGDEPDNFEGTGDVDYDPWLEEPDDGNPYDGDCTSGLNKSSGPVTLAKTSSSKFDTQDFLLYRQGITAYKKENYASALASFESLLNKYEDSFFARFALQKWLIIKFKMNAKEDILPYLNSLKSTKSLKLNDYIKKMEVLVQRKFSETENALSLIGEYSSSGKSAGYNSFFKYQQGLIYQYDLKDKKQAETIFTEYLQLYPDDARKPLVLSHLNLLSTANDTLVKKESDSAEGSSGEKTPYKFALSANYPNPFNPSTTITFSLPEEGMARLAVYDLAGRLVKTLRQGRLEAGFHSVKWDGRNTLGDTVASGVYVYMLRFKDKILSRKMLLLR